MYQCKITPLYFNLQIIINRQLGTNELLNYG